jgi:hypothetical protein
MIHKILNGRITRSYLREDERLHEDEIEHWRVRFGLAFGGPTSVTAIIGRLSDPHVIANTIIDSSMLCLRPCVVIGRDHASIGLKRLTSR